MVVYFLLWTMIEGLLFEMSSFFTGISDINNKRRLRIGNGNYYLALNGDKDYVRPPHIHIYDKKDKQKTWTIEINFQRFLCTGDVYIRRIKTSRSDIYPTTEQQIQYESTKEIIYDILFMRPNVNKPEYIVNAKDNIAAAIAIFNEEADIIRNGKKEYADIPKQEKLLTIIKENCNRMKILPKFRDYFPKDLQKKYSMCFQ